MVVVEELGILLEADPTGLEEGLEKANVRSHCKTRGDG